MSGGRTRGVILALSPATLPKGGSGLRPGAGLRGTGRGQYGAAARLDKAVLLGELALDGRLRPVRGVLPAVIGGASRGHGPRGGAVPRARRGRPGGRHRGAGARRTCGRCRVAARASWCCPVRPRRRCRPSGDGPTSATWPARGTRAGRSRSRLRGAPPDAHRAAGHRARPCWRSGCGAAAGADRSGGAGGDRESTRWPGCCHRRRR